MTTSTSGGPIAGLGFSKAMAQQKIGEALKILDSAQRHCAPHQGLSDANAQLIETIDKLQAIKAALAT